MADDLALLSHRILDMRDKTGLGGTRCEGRPEDHCHQDKVNAYWYQTWRCVSVPGGRIKEVDEFYGSIVSKKAGLKIEAQPGLGILKYNKKRSLAKNFEKEYKLSAVDLQPSTDKMLNVN